MIKNLSIFLLGVIAVMLVLLAFKGCDSKPTPIEAKSIESLKQDSIQRVITDSIISSSESKIKVFQKQDSIHKASISKLTIKYNALRAIVKGLGTIKVDSFEQTTTLPTVEYNTLVEQGNTCDSLISEYESLCRGKDSIIHLRTLEYEAESNMNQANEQALKDIIPLVGELKTKLKKAQNTNKKLTVALIIDTALHFFH